MAKSGADILREYVVSLGFQVEEEQFRNFSKRLDKIVTGIGEIALAVGVVGTAIERNVTRMAAKFEDLHYAAAKSGASVRGLQDLEYGAQQIGLAAGQATAQIEELATTFRSNPGIKAAFSDIIGSSSDPTKQFISIIEGLKKLDTGPLAHAYVAQRASMLGISEPDLVLLEKGVDKLKEASDLHDKMLRDAGLDPDKVAENSVRFDNDVRRLQASIEIVKSLILERFMPGVDALVHGITRVVDLVSRADKATGGGSTYALEAGAVGLSWLAAKGGLGFLRGMLTGGLGEGAAAGASGVLAGVGPLVAIVGAVIAALGLGWLLKRTGALDVGGKYSAHNQVDQFRRWIGLDKDAGDAPIVDASGEAGVAGNNPGNLRRWARGQAMFSRKGSGSFVAFASAMEGLSAMAGQLLRYGSAGNNTIEGIISKWAPKNENNTAAYIARVSRALGVGASQHLDLSNPSVLQALIHAITKGEQGRDPYSNALVAAAVSQRLSREGGRSVHIDQKVTVHGAGDPHRTAAMTSQEVARVNQDAVRAFLPRTQ